MEVTVQWRETGFQAPVVLLAGPHVWGTPCTTVYDEPDPSPAIAPTSLSLPEKYVRKKEKQATNIIFAEINPLIYSKSLILLNRIVTISV